ncbi:unknown [Firmicutes bacterium CAG:822]|nr:unknown [Firmicutes bacterium CAG:822]
MSKCKAVLDGKKISSIKVNTKKDQKDKNSK